MFLANLALLCGVSVDRVSATSDRRSMRERIVMELYDNLDDKLFLYMRGILHKTNIPPQVGKRGNAMSVSVCLVCLSVSISQELHVQWWWRGTVVERRSLAGELSLSCA